MWFLRHDMNTLSATVTNDCLETADERTFYTLIRKRKILWLYSEERSSENIVTGKISNYRGRPN